MAPFSPVWEKIGRSRPSSCRIAFTDAHDPRILEAVSAFRASNLIQPVLVGTDPISAADRPRFVDLLVQKQQKLNLTPEKAEQQLNDPIYHGIALLLDGQVDGLVGGATRPTADIVRAALQCVGPRAGTHLVAGHFLIEPENHPTADKSPFLFADCAVVPEPSPRSLAAIAMAAAESYRFFTGGEPKVALLSFSTRGSAEHPLVDRIREALTIIHKQAPGLIVDGEIQADAALDAGIAAIKKAADSPVAGKANVFVFPTLEAGNIGYKLVQRFASTRIAGPFLWGLAKPVSDLSRGCTVQEVVDTAHCVKAMIGGMN